MERYKEFIQHFPCTSIVITITLVIVVSRLAELYVGVVT